MTQPGRSCPLHYGYAAAALAAVEALSAETLYLVGGLYGNRQALVEVLRMAAAEAGPVTICFNGDFHWFDVDPETFAAVNDAVLGRCATRGNVESEISARADAGAGCGCAYPSWVDAGTVTRSNAIIDRLRATARAVPEAGARLAELPMYRVAEVGALRIGIVHGDAHSLAGWGFSQEALQSADAVLEVAALCERARVGVFASSHSCLPVACMFPLPSGGNGALLNNGAAGMPNFDGTRFGLISRISVCPSLANSSLYGARLDGAYLDALPVAYDHEAFEREFSSVWPPGSAAHESYYARIVNGPDFAPSQAARAGFA